MIEAETKRAYMYTHTYACVLGHTGKHQCVWICIYIHMCTHGNVYTYMYTCIYLYMCVYIYLCVHIFYVYEAICTLMYLYMYMYIYIYTCTYICTCNTGTFKKSDKHREAARCVAARLAAGLAALSPGTEGHCMLGFQNRKGPYIHIHIYVDT